MGRPRQLPPIPLGPGTSAVRLAMRAEDVVVLGGILLGYDGLASIHADDDEALVLITTDAMRPMLDELLAELAREIPMTRLSSSRGAPPEGAT